MVFLLILGITIWLFFGAAAVAILTNQRKRLPPSPGAIFFAAVFWPGVFASLSWDEE